MNDTHLIMVTGDNNNKFYDMHDNTNGTFTVTYGRVGVTSTTKEYPIKQWNSIYKEKTKKGYVDHSGLFITKNHSGFTQITNKDVNSFVEALQKFANTSISANYTVDANAVTQAQVDKAQQLLDNLVTLSGKQQLIVKDANDALLELYAVIPRRMAHVQDHLIDKPKTKSLEVDDRKNFKEMITSEQQTLDVMSGQVVSLTAVSIAPQTILDTIGLTVELVNDTAADFKMVQKLMDSDKNKLMVIYKITHKRTYDKFTAVSTHNDKLLWHGSRNENWWSILGSGLLIRPTNAVINGKMFGYGIYGADKFAKSYGYTSGYGSRWASGTQNVCLLGLFNFNLGNQLILDNKSSWNKDFELRNLRKSGYDSVYAKPGYGLYNSEFIVYEEERVTIGYLVKVKAQ